MNTKLSLNQAPSEYCVLLSKLYSRTTNPKLGLSRMVELLDAISFDRSSMKIIQVVGTNGKGSTVAFIESILHSAGIPTGLFTSPHLITARERIRINKELISETDFIYAARHILRCSENLSDEASFFECILAMALWLFQQKGIKAVILEAGLGGRLDATTAVKPDILGVSMIDFDHQHILGTSVKAIAHEKIHAAHSGETVVTVKQSAEALSAIEQAQKDLGFTLVHAPSCAKEALALYGNHQKDNAGLAVALVKEVFPHLNVDAIQEGLLSVQWPGRFEIIHDDAIIVLDGAHNPSGIATLVKSLQEHPHFSRQRLVLVYGSLSGASVLAKIAGLLSSSLAISHVFLHAPRNPRALSHDELRALFEKQGLSASKLSVFSDWNAVVSLAKELDGRVVVCGSLYTIGEIRSEIMHIPMDNDMPNF